MFEKETVQNELPLVALFVYVLNTVLFRMVFLFCCKAGEMMKKKLSYGNTMLLFAGTLLVAFICSALLGRYPMTVKELAGMIASRLMNVEPFWTPVQESLFFNHRLPRILMACLVGCCLSTSGAAYQGIFQNPMAAPDILGASSGAAFGAALAILFGMGSSLTIAFAFIFSLLTVMIVIYIGNHAKGKSSVALILSGVMIGSLVSSGTSFIKLVADPNDQLPAITYWLMGSLNGVLPEDVYFALVPMVIGLVPLLLLRWRINILTFGDEEAQTMGVNAKLLRTILIICSTLITAASVSVSGMIGWVGLVIPHMARRIVGNNYKQLLPASMILGAIFMLIVDNISRNLYATEIPIGILTSFIGAPFFIYLITKDGEY